MRAWITDEDDHRVRNLTPGKRKRYRQGPQSLTWSGRDSQGKMVESGLYKVVIEAEASYSSATYFKKREVKRFYVK